MLWSLRDDDFVEYHLQYRRTPLRDVVLAVGFRISYRLRQVLGEPVSFSLIMGSADRPYMSGVTAASVSGTLLMAPNSCRLARTTGASSYLAADFANSPRRDSSARSWREVQPSSRASSYTRTFGLGGGSSFIG
jgi:hypothetical protein